MPEYKMRLELSRIGSDQPMKVVEETVASVHEATPEGEENLGIELAAEFQKAIRYHEYFEEIPRAEDDLVNSTSRTMDLSQWFDVRNT